MSSGIGLYDVKFVKSIKRKNILLTILWLVTALYLYQFWSEKHIAVNAVQNKLENVQSTLESTSKELDALKAKEETRKKKLDAVASLIMHINPSISNKQAHEQAEYEIYYAKKYNNDLFVSLAITYHETYFKCSLISYDSSSYGCKQINLEAWKDKYNLTTAKLFNPKFNIALGNKMLAMHIREYNGNVGKAIERYRGGTLPSTNIEYRQNIFSKAKYIEKFITKRLTA